MNQDFKNQGINYSLTPKPEAVILDAMAGEEKKWREIQKKIMETYSRNGKPPRGYRELEDIEPPPGYEQWGDTPPFRGDPGQTKPRNPRDYWGKQIK